MAYPRNYGYKYKYKKRYNKNYKKKFSRFNTYRNRSSKAQAYQIYALNNRVNYLMKKTKPETIQYEPNDKHITISFDGESNIWYTTAGQMDFTTETFRNGIQHKSARINKLIVSGTLERENAYEQQTFHRRSSAFILMAILQTKSERDTTTTPSAIFDTTSGPLSFKKPLMDGASKYDRILRVIRVKMTEANKNVISFKKTIRLKYPIYRKPTSTDSFGKGHLYAVIAAYQDYDRTVGQFTFNLSGKLEYTDA